MGSTAIEVAEFTLSWGLSLSSTFIQRVLIIQQALPEANSSQAQTEFNTLLYWRTCDLWMCFHKAHQKKVWFWSLNTALKHMRGPAFLSLMSFPHDLKANRENRPCMQWVKMKNRVRAKLSHMFLSDNKTSTWCPAKRVPVWNDFRVCDTCAVKVLKIKTQMQCTWKKTTIYLLRRKCRDMLIWCRIEHNT